jgi:GrpB-like predicted nucleotidyltransferase (UPF0157 family)
MRCGLAVASWAVSINYTPIQVKPFDSGWAEEFQERAAALGEALGAVAERIDHIGSTAVAGLDAKPTIDIQVSVADLDELDSYRGPIEQLGYTFHEGSLKEAGHRFFSAPERAAHVHVCCSGSKWERRHLLFRDYLRAHPDAAARYVDLKHELADRYRTDREAYAEAKGTFVENEMAAAEPWAHATGWSLGATSR